MFNLAEDWEYCLQNTNPVSKVERYREAPRERYLSELELLSLGKALDLALKHESETPHFIALIRLLLLTGANQLITKNKYIETAMIGKMPNRQLTIYNKLKEITIKRKEYWFDLWGGGEIKKN